MRKLNEFHPPKILTVTIESNFTSDSNCSSNQRTEAKGAGFANPVVSSNIWSSLKTQKLLNCAKIYSKADSRC